MLIMSNTRRARTQGFSLVELMVALVVGLIVVGAVLALVVSIMKSNRQTLQSTRLNQELRATMAVIANDLRRGRSVTDPLTTAKAIGGNPYKDVDTATAGCVIFAYDGATGGPWHVIKLSAGKVVLQTAVAKPTCTSITTTPTPFGSDQVQITSLIFTPATTSTTASTTRKFDVTITGNLVDQDAELSGVTRTITESVFVRSIGTGS
jgi:prepilin-type N-terminal cleavage/methylation domain-containing protein